jgi:mRNA interferase RelE/StbE
MIFEIKFANKAGKAIAKIEAKLRDRIHLLLKELQVVQIPAKEYDIKKIKGEEDTYRVRISNYRIVYRIRSNLGVIEVSRSKGAPKPPTNDRFGSNSGKTIKEVPIKHLQYDQ